MPLTWIALVKLQEPDQIASYFAMMSKKPLNTKSRLDELVDSFPADKILSFLDEAFENHLRGTNLTGPPLAEQYYILTELKAVIMAAGQ